MTKETKSFELTDVQKTRLLQIALHRPASDGPVSEDEAKGDLLCDLLRSRLPCQPGRRQEPMVAAPMFSEGFRSVLGPPLGELLHDPHVSVATLREIKEYAKSLGINAKSDREKDVYLVLYLAAIAAAMVFHDERITEHSDRDLAQFFRSFARAPWILSGLRDVFVQANGHPRLAELGKDATER